MRNSLIHFSPFLKPGDIVKPQEQNSKIKKGKPCKVIATTDGKYGRYLVFEDKYRNPYPGQYMGSYSLDSKIPIKDLTNIVKREFPKVFNAILWASKTFGIEFSIKIGWDTILKISPTEYGINIFEIDYYTAKRRERVETIFKDTIKSDNGINSLGQLIMDQINAKSIIEYFHIDKKYVGDSFKIPENMYKEQADNLKEFAWTKEWIWRFFHIINSLNTSGENRLPEYLYDSNSMIQRSQACSLEMEGEMLEYYKDARINLVDRRETFVLYEYDPNDMLKIGRANVIHSTYSFANETAWDLAKKLDLKAYLDYTSNWVWDHDATEQEYVYLLAYVRLLKDCPKSYGDTAISKILAGTHKKMKDHNYYGLMKNVKRADIFDFCKLISNWLYYRDLTKNEENYEQDEYSDWWGTNSYDFNTIDVLLDDAISQV